MVIRALPRVLAAHPDVVYVMVGLPEKQAEYTALAEELGVAQALRFAGRESPTRRTRRREACWMGRGGGAHVL